MPTIILPPLINGKSYENADVRLSVMGTLLAGVTAINYGEEWPDMGGIHGSGSDYVSYGNGKKEKSGSITLLMEEVVNIMAIAPLGDIGRIPLFPIVVSYTDASLQSVTHTITAKFKKNVFDHKTGDTSIPITLDLFVAAIKWK